MVKYLTFEVGIVPEAKQRPRMNMKTGGVYTPSKTKQYEAAIRDAWGRKYRKKHIITGPIEVKIRFTLPRPKNMRWKNKPMYRVPHTKKPDLDNLVKAVVDALNRVAFADDSQIYRTDASKSIASGEEQPGIWVRIVDASETSSEKWRDGEW